MHNIYNFTYMRVNLVSHLPFSGLQHQATTSTFPCSLLMYHQMLHCKTVSEQHHLHSFYHWVRPTSSSILGSPRSAAAVSLNQPSVLLSSFHTIFQRRYRPMWHITLYFSVSSGLNSSYLHYIIPYYVYHWIFQEDIK